MMRAICAGEAETFLQQLFRVRRFPDVSTIRGICFRSEANPKRVKSIGFCDSFATVILAKLSSPGSAPLDDMLAAGAITSGRIESTSMSKRAIRVSEAEAANDFASLLARVRAGAEVVIERDAEAVAVIRPAAPHVRLLSESLRLAKERGSNATLDGDFGRDLEAVVSSHREPLTPPAWD